MFKLTFGVFLPSNEGSENNCCCSRQSRRNSPRSNGNASLLRLSHGRLFQSLVGNRTHGSEPAAHLFRKLVPHGQRWKIPVARIRREYARSEMGRRSSSRTGL